MLASNKAVVSNGTKVPPTGISSNEVVQISTNVINVPGSLSKTISSKSGFGWHSNNQIILPGGAGISSRKKPGVFPVVGSVQVIVGSDGGGPTKSTLISINFVLLNKVFCYIQPYIAIPI